MLIKSDSSPAAKIIVVGVGGGGGNAVNTMISMDIQNVEFIAMNTDKQALEASLAPHKILLGEDITKGLGGGGNWEVGKAAAEEAIDLIHDALAGADMVFITAGMGGATGTGAGPVIAGIAKGLGALTVGVVYQPFLFEGKKRQENAARGLAEMRDKVDTLITIPNQKILESIDKRISFIEAMKRGDDVLGQAIKSISDIITVSGFINVDFADVKSVMKDAGSAVMGMGIASGEDRATIATRNAISSPLLDLSIGGAHNALVSITGNRELGMQEISEVMDIVQQYLAEDANIIVGAAIDDNMENNIKVTVLATGFADKASARYQNGMNVSMPNYVQNNVPLHAQQTLNTSSQPTTSTQDDNQDDDSIQMRHTSPPQRNNTYNQLNFKKKPQFPESSPRSNAADLNQGDDEITQIPAFLRRKKD